MIATTPSIDRPFLRRPDCVASVAITVVAIWLHIFFLFHAGGLWRDEINTLNVSAKPLAEMGNDSFPVLTPVIVRLWSLIAPGADDFELRILGALAGVAIIAAFWIATWTARRSPPLLSLVFFGLNVTAINYGDSLRPYGMACVWIILSVAAAGWVLKKPSRARVSVLALTMVLSVQTLYQNAFFVFAICAGGWAVCVPEKNWKTAMKFLLAGVVAAVSLLPYSGHIISLSNTPTILRLGFNPTEAWANFQTAAAFPFMQYIYVWAGLALVVIVAALVTFFRCASNGEMSAVRRFAAVTLLVIIPGFILFLRITGVHTQLWYFLTLMAILVVCFDLGVPALPRIAQTAGFGFVIASALISVPFAQKELNVRFTNADTLSARLSAEASPEDRILVVPWYYGISFDHYYKGKAPWSTVPPVADHSIHRFDLADAAEHHSDLVQPFLDGLGSVLQSGHRVWVVGNLQGFDNRARNGAWKSFNWNDGGDHWVPAVAGYLSDHGLQWQSLPHRTNDNVSYEENFKILVVYGWQDGATNSSH